MPVDTIQNDNNGEISLLDIYEFFEDGWKWIAASTLVCSFVGVAYALLATPVYEATANIQMATVANSVVETPAILGEKLGIPTYFSNEAISGCGSDDLPASGESLAKGLHPVVNKNAPILTISYRSKTVGEAKECLGAVLANIRENQNLIATPILTERKFMLGTLEDKLESAEKIEHQFADRKMSFDFNDPKFSASTLLFSTLLANDNKIKDLRRQIYELKGSLSEPQTKETYLVAPIYASDRRVEPKRSRIVIGSALGGLFLGLLFLLGKRVRANLRLQLSSK